MSGAGALCQRLSSGARGAVIPGCRCYRRFPSTRPESEQPALPEPGDRAAEGLLDRRVSEPELAGGAAAVEPVAVTRHPDRLRTDRDRQWEEGADRTGDREHPFREEGGARERPDDQLEHFYEIGGGQGRPAEDVPLTRLAATRRQDVPPGAVLDVHQ